MRALINILIALVLFSPEVVFGQCGTDANFKIVHPNPEENQDVLILYDGYIAFDADWSYYVDFGNGSSNSGTGIPADNVLGIANYTTAGTYTIQVVITDDITYCSNTQTQTVVVVAENTSCPLTNMGNYNRITCKDEQVNFLLVLADDINYPLIDAEWNFGDGNTTTTTNASITHAYTTPGINYVTALVNLDDNSTDCERFAVSSADDGMSGTVEVGYIEVLVKGGDPQFTYNPVNPISTDAVTFTYTGMPYLAPPDYVNDYGFDFILNTISENSATTGLDYGDVLHTENPIGSGVHTAILIVYYNDTDFDGRGDCSESDTIVFEIPTTACDTCSSFRPEEGKRYWLSAWVKVDEPDQVKSYNPNDLTNSLNVNPATLDDAYIELEFTGGSTTAQFYPTGDIIDGWQRIVGEFTIPAGTYDLSLNVYADDDEDTYFDDIRIHPFNASMKSYVYDGETFWLLSELDDNNYATFYEYDKEGGLVRIKKETSRGIVTIQETRSSTTKE